MNCKGKEKKLERNWTKKNVLKPGYEKTGKEMERATKSYYSKELKK